MRKIAGLCVLLSGLAAAQPAGIRGSCQLFVERHPLTPPGVRWLDVQAWTVVDNRDGTYSVGARYMVPNATRVSYTTCVIRPAGSTFELVKLARLL